MLGWGYFAVLTSSPLDGMMRVLPQAKSSRHCAYKNEKMTEQGSYDRQQTGEAPERKVKEI